MRAVVKPGRELVATPVGIRLPDAPMVFEQWRQLGQKLGLLHNGSTWALADWALYGSRHYARSQGSRYDAVVELTGLAHQTLKNYAWTARRFPLERRRPKLSFYHHFRVSSLPEPVQEELLDRAERERLSSQDLRRHVRAHRTRASLPRVGRPPKATGLVTLDVEPERRARWELAAKERGLPLETWLADVADEAAVAVSVAA